MIDTHKNVTRYKIQHELHYVNKYVNNPTFTGILQVIFKSDILSEPSPWHLSTECTCQNFLANL